MLLRLSVSLSLAAAMAVAVANQGLPSAPHLSVTQRSAFLVMRPEVRQELNLTDSQRTAITNAIVAHAKSQMSALNSEELDETTLVALDKAYSSKVLGTLTPVQQKSILILALKQVGVHALLDEDIATRLKIDKDQKSKLMGLLKEIDTRNEDFQEMVAKGFDHFIEPKTDEERQLQAKQKEEIVKSYAAERLLVDEANAKTVEKVLAVLTEAQRDQWKALTGTAPSK